MSVNRQNVKHNGNHKQISAISIKWIKLQRVNNKNKCFNILESFQKNDDDGAVAQDLVDNQYGEVNEHENDDDDGDNVGDDGDDDVDDGIAVVALDLVYSQYGGGGRLILTFTTTIANTKI